MLAFRREASIAPINFANDGCKNKNTLDILAIIGVSLLPDERERYVPMPGYKRGTNQYVDHRKTRKAREPNLIINHLLRFIVPFQHRDELHNIRIIGIELISRPIEAHD